MSDPAVREVGALMTALGQRVFRADVENDLPFLVTLLELLPCPELHEMIQRMQARLGCLPRYEPPRLPS